MKIAPLWETRCYAPEAEPGAGAPRPAQETASAPSTDPASTHRLPVAAPLAQIAALERACLNAVPATRIVLDGPLVLRAFHGGTGRANAACSLNAEPDAALEARLERCITHYQRLGLPPRFRSTPLDPPGMGALLAARGFVQRDETLVLAGPIGAVAAAAVADDAPPPASAVAETPVQIGHLAEPEPEWLSVIGTAEYQTEARRAEKTQQTALLGVPANWLVLRRAGHAVAAGFAVADGPLCGVFDLAVRPEERRRGFARRIMAAAGSWGVAQGAETLWVQVSATNAASLGVMAGLGLREAYRYRYYQWRA